MHKTTLSKNDFNIKKPYNTVAKGVMGLISEVFPIFLTNLSEILKKKLLMLSELVYMDILFFITAFAITA